MIGGLGNAGDRRGGDAVGNEQALRSFDDFLDVIRAFFAAFHGSFTSNKFRPARQRRRWIAGKGSAFSMPHFSGVCNAEKWHDSAQMIAPGHGGWYSGSSDSMTMRADWARKNEEEFL